MSKKITAVNPNGMSKYQLGEYVNQMARLERDIYALEETEKQLRNDAIASKNEAQSISNSQFYSSAKEPQPPKKPMAQEKPSVMSHIFKSIGYIFLSWLPLYFICGVAIVLLSQLVTGTATLDFNLLFLTPTIAAVIVGPIVYALMCKKRNREYDEKCKAYKVAYDYYVVEKEKYEKQLKDEAATFNATRNNKEKYALQVANTYIMQADTLNGKISELKDLRDSMYSVGFIPPDYRTMDCVYGLNHIFRNDLADNMRDAVLQYEERVTSKAIIKGMSNIISRLDRLGSSMAYLTNEIHSVNENVYSMRQEIATLANAAAESSKINQNILQESKATRYATQSMQDQINYIYRTDYLHIT